MSRIKFGEWSGLIEGIAKVVNDAKWRSAWLVLIEAKQNSWYIIDRIYWNTPIIPVIDIEDKKNVSIPADEQREEFWLQNDLYFLKLEDKQILMSDAAWLNDRIMDAAQRLICKALGNEDAYQSVRNTPRKYGVTYPPVDNEHVQVSLIE